MNDEGLTMNEKEGKGGRLVRNLLCDRILKSKIINLQFITDFYRYFLLLTRYFLLPPIIGGKKLN